MSCIVAHQRATCIGLQYMHTMLFQLENDHDACLWLYSVALQSDLSCNSKPHEEVYDSIALFRYVECPYDLYSFKLCVWVCINGVSETDCDACLEPWLTSCISHTALTQKMDIFDSRTVVWYIECLYMTYSFQVMHVSVYKMAYWKETAMHVWSHISSLLLAHMQL